MIVAWLVLSSVGIFTSRNLEINHVIKSYKINLIWLIQGYYKYIFPKVKIFDVQFWFVAHRSLMVSTLLVSLGSFVVILYHMGWTWITPAFTINFAHSIVGIITIGLTFFQVNLQLEFIHFAEKIILFSINLSQSTQCFVQKKMRQIVTFLILFTEQSDLLHTFSQVS
jgi:hypothetical protein